MRKSLIAAAALAAAVPAVAQPQGYDEPVYEDDRVVDHRYDDEAPLGVLDPRETAHMAQVLDRLIGAVMDLPIGGLAQAIDPEGRGDYRRGDTIRDMATRDDPYAEQRLRAGIQGATRGIGAMNQALARAMPVLQRSLEEVSRTMGAAIEEAVEAGRPY